MSDMFVIQFNIYTVRRWFDWLKFMLYEHNTWLYTKQWFYTIGVCICNGMECMFVCRDNIQKVCQWFNIGYHIK